MDIAYSINGIPSRLTEERWLHIIERHFDLFNELYARYDKEADALYVMFDKDSKVYLSRDGADDVLLEYDINERLVGLTIMDVSTRT